MRVIFSVLGLLLVVMLVAFMAKKQLGGLKVSNPVSSAASSPDSGGAKPQPPAVTAPQQVKQTLDAVLQQARPMPEDVK